MFSLKLRRSSASVRIPNHTVLYGIVTAALGAFICLGAATRLYELKEFFPLRLPEQLNEFLLNYVPFMFGVFITTVAACAGIIVGLNWLFGGLRRIARMRVTFRDPKNFYRLNEVTEGLREGKITTYDSSPSLIFYVLGRVWSNARYISHIPGHIIKWNMKFIWKAIAVGIVIHFFFKILESAPSYLASLGFGGSYLLPSPYPFYKFLFIVCILKLFISVLLIPLKKPEAAREMDSMIVEGKGHPSLFFSIIEEGSKIFAHRNLPNRVMRSKATKGPDGETTIGSLIESFPEYVKTSNRIAALLCLMLGSIMCLVGFLQLILMQYPSFSVAYDDFFRIYMFTALVDILLNTLIILFGKSFLDQAQALMAIYRFKSNLVYVEAKGDFDNDSENKSKSGKKDKVAFDPLRQGAFNVRYFSAEAISESVTPEGPRELIGLCASEVLSKDVSNLKYLPFQIQFLERYPSSWADVEILEEKDLTCDLSDESIQESHEQPGACTSA
ncbi:MAG: hypothetical protein M1511_17035 [Deltaproteobacteria bacterium]|nr:hypothetical protein [Deltaproteobacteria bacterium]